MANIYIRVCLVVIQDGQILLVPHFETDAGPVQYNVPGGGVEFGESLKDAAIRECHEETGYEVNCHDLLDIYEHHRPDWHSITIAFRGTISGGAPRAEQTRWGERVPRWFFPDELRTVPYHPAPLIEKVMKIIGE